jgi:hypothetical protein
MVGDRSNEERAMSRPSLAFAGLALTLASGVAAATEPSVSPAVRVDRCASVPREQFRPEAELAAVVERFGYKIVRVSTDAGCYAVLGADRSGTRFDMRFEGTNLRMVSRYLARSGPDAVAQR